MKDFSLELNSVALYKRPAGDMFNCDTCKTCPANTWCNKDKALCDKCSSPSWIFRRDCISICPAGLYKLKVGKKFTCVECTRCPKNTYCDKAKRMCLPCHKDCLTCVGTADTCVFPCARPKIWTNFKCVDECPAGFFAYGSKD